MLTDRRRWRIRLPHRFRGPHTVRQRVAPSSAWACIALAGCATSLHARPVLETPATPPPPLVSVAALDRLLLGPDEIKLLTVSAVSGHGLRMSMLDRNGKIGEKACAAIDETTDESVYAGSGWTGVRRQQFFEPGDNHDHFVEQAVVSFPTARGAMDFFDASSRLWSDCANRRYHVAADGKPDLVWTVGPVSNVDGILSTIKTQEGANGWNCQRALTAGNNVVVDVVACGYGHPDIGIVIARQIGAKVSS